MVLELKSCMCEQLGDMTSQLVADDAGGWLYIDCVSIPGAWIVELSILSDSVVCKLLQCL